MRPLTADSVHSVRTMQRRSRKFVPVLAVRLHKLADISREYLRLTTYPSSLVA